MFNVYEMYKLLNELDDNSENPQVISIYTTIQLLPSELTEDVNKLSEQEVEEWFDFASTVEGIIDNFGEVVNTSISNRPDSISEYIDFYCYDEDGNKKNYIVDLRLSDHKSTNLARQTRLKRVKRINGDYQLFGITVNDENFDSYDEAIYYLRKYLSKKLKSEKEKDND